LSMNGPLDDRLPAAVADNLTVGTLDAAVLLDISRTVPTQHRGLRTLREISEGPASDCEHVDEQYRWVRHTLAAGRLPRKALFDL
jgi:hypothetical protein